MGFGEWLTEGRLQGNRAGGDGSVRIRGLKKDEAASPGSLAQTLFLVPDVHDEQFAEWVDGRVLARLLLLVLAGPRNPNGRDGAERRVFVELRVDVSTKDLAADLHEAG